MDDGWLVDEPGVRRDEPLDRHSEYGIGGPADWYLRVRDAAHLARLMRRCQAAGVPVTVIGAGSNSLVLDGGIRGLVVELPRGRLRRLSDDARRAARGGDDAPRGAGLCRPGVGGSGVRDRRPRHLRRLGPGQRRRLRNRDQGRPRRLRHPGAGRLGALLRGRRAGLRVPRLPSQARPRRPHRGRRPAPRPRGPAGGRPGPHRRHPGRAPGHPAVRPAEPGQHVHQPTR